MRRGCCPREELKRGAWTSQEDKLLSDYIKVHGLGKWRSLPANAGLNRCGKSCRLRWLNYLRPDIKRGNITEEEEELIIRLHKLLGNRWSLIAGRLPGRTDNEIKNYWNTYLRKKVAGASSEQQSSPRTKNDSTEKPTAEKKDRSDVSVVRTKAERCMRSLLTDQPPKPAELDSDSFSNTNEHNAFPPFRMDDPWMQELMQNSFLPQDSVDNFQKSIESLKQFGNAEISFKEDNYMTGLLGAGAKESEGLYSFFDPGYWDSLFMAKRA